MAYGLLALKPWELGRCTVREVEQMMAGYALRRAHERDLLAWHAVYTMQATGNYEKGNLPTLRDLLGRDPLPVDPRWTREPEPIDVDAAHQRELNEATAQAAAGTGVIGHLSAEALALAYAQAHVDR